MKTGDNGKTFALVVPYMDGWIAVVDDGGEPCRFSDRDVALEALDRIGGGYGGQKVYLLEETYTVHESFDIGG